MVSKIKGAAEYIIKNEPKKLKIIIALGLVGIILISMSEMFSSSSNKTSADSETSTFSYSDYTRETEEKLTSVISAIDGVGDCEVMITFSSTQESVYATDSENKSETDSQSTKDEYVIYDGENGENPVLIKQNYPAVLGVSVVCGGGDDVRVKEAVVNTVTSLFNISANRVSVSKIKSDN